MKKVNYRYASLEDFLITHQLTVDAGFDDGGGVMYPVKGREIEAAILFADIRSFSSITYDLEPVATLIFVNRFFTWISAEALRSKPAIIDKYIGDEIMVVFSPEFGSDDHIKDAIQTARAMIEFDTLAFRPHIGISAGKVVVGYVGTPLKYNCSVFGRPVAEAARCAAMKSSRDGPASSIFFPSHLWRPEYDFADVIPPRRTTRLDGSVQEDQLWELLDPVDRSVKNMPDLSVRELIKRGSWFPSFSVAQQAAAAWENVKKAK